MPLAVAALMVALVTVVLVARPRRDLSVAARNRRLDVIDPDGGPDLPCPWCEAPTREDDSVCSGCHQRFG